ncbi:MAG: hypothetical protein KJ630_14595 [Proteobacteria bacterium]|nr:hypothetical protein [Pseudomonadota bacterium]
MVVRKSSESKESGGSIQQTLSWICWVMALVGVVTAGTIAAKPVLAEEEWRVGGMIQIPFGGTKRQSFVHFIDTRIGVKVQYAAVDDVIMRNEQAVERVYQDGVLQSSTVISDGVVTVQGGDKVVGGEGYLLVAPFNGFWDVSGGINGFAGQDTIQGAVGLGYDPSFGVYIGIGGLFPFSEAGIRLNFRHIDYFVGATSFPKFSEKTVLQEDNIRYIDILQTSPVEEEVEVTEVLLSGF